MDSISPRGTNRNHCGVRASEEGKVPPHPMYFCGARQEVRQNSFPHLRPEQWRPGLVPSAYSELRTEKLPHWSVEAECQWQRRLLGEGLQNSIHGKSVLLFNFPVNLKRLQK